MEPPDTLEKSIRFGCGFLFGCAALVTSTLIYTITSREYFATLCLVVGLSCGYAAMKLGDRFWVSLFRWWWP